ncbi:MAG: hypothetical protein HPY55_02130 [Firmicutes bacterium]|nr:hypothetical protein [Bacillota bacterium]
MSVALVSLLGILVAIAIGFAFDISTGLVSVAFAFVVGQFLGGMKPNDIIAGWPTNLFFILFGVTLLFAIAKTNGTLELLARKSVYAARGQAKLIPIVFFLLAFVLAAIGPGNISVCALVHPISMAVAQETGISPLLMALMVIAGSNAGGLSPIAPTGIIGVELAKKQGLDTGMHVWINMIILQIIIGIVSYVFFGGLKISTKGQLSRPNPFDKNQLVTLGGIAALVLTVVFLKWNVGLAAFLVAAALLLFKVADQKKSVAAVPWMTLLLVCGVGVMVNVAGKTGGIKLLTDFLGSFMTPRSAAAIMALTGGAMSTFSSASGVVMPTLIPTVPGLIQKLGTTVPPESLVSAVVQGAHAVTNSPLSTLGALAMAAAPDTIDREKLFRELLAVGIGGVLFVGILMYFGIVR